MATDRAVERDEMGTTVFERVYLQRKRRKIHILYSSAGSYDDELLKLLM